MVALRRWVVVFALYRSPQIRRVRFGEQPTLQILNALSIAGVDEAARIVLSDGDQSRGGRGELFRFCSSEFDRCALTFDVEFRGASVLLRSECWKDSVRVNARPQFWILQLFCFSDR